jgi:pimeloyl-ACP methyl ester carboxylesterase
VAITPFEIPCSDSDIADLRRRLAATRWPDEIAGSNWEYGVELPYLREICSYWQEHFDWRHQVGALSKYRHYRFERDGFGVHFVHEPSAAPSAIPLIITHGWPGSFLEMLGLIPLLTVPDPNDPSAVSFDLVIPSLPGFGFSDRPTERGMNSERIAALWAGLMEELGYERFAVQGGDFGANVATFLGLRHAGRVIGIHLNYIPGSYRPWVDPGVPVSDDERQFLADADRWYQEHGAYAHVQGREPQTLGCALNDSPAGLAAWILEKFRLWADCGGDLANRFSRDELLANVTLYWMTQTIASSSRLYLETRRHPVHFTRNERVDVPCAIARFPLESPFPPRSWIERGYNVRRWTEMPRGGHFAAMEEPELLAADVRTFFSRLALNPAART